MQAGTVRVQVDLTSAVLQQASFDFTNPSVSVQADCQRAVDALKRMTDPSEGGSAVKDNAILPVDYLQRCKVLTCPVGTKQPRP